MHAQKISKISAAGREGAARTPMLFLSKTTLSYEDTLLTYERLPHANESF